MSTEMPLAVTWKKNNRKYKSGRIVGNINDNVNDDEKFNPIYTIHESHIIWFTKKQSEKLPDIGTKVNVIVGGKIFKGQIIADVGNEKFWNNNAEFKKISLNEIIGRKLNQEKIRILHTKALQNKEMI